MSGTSVIHLTQASSGAPSCTGQDGSLVAILDWGLVQNGWAIEYTSGNARIYRPGAGNRFRLHAYHDTAVSGDARKCLIRGCENASSATVLVDPFPTVALSADNASNWLTSTTANSTARDYDLYVGTTWMMMFINAGGLTNVWDFNFFGDVVPTLTGDSYNTICQVRNSTSTAQITTVQWSFNPGSQGVAGKYWARSYDGTVKSTFGNLVQQSPLTTNAQSGPSGGIDNSKSFMLDTGQQSTAASTTMSQPARGWFPNLRTPMHIGRGVVNSRDTFTDSAYDPASLFRVFTSGNSAGSYFLVVEESTDTWNPPSG